MLEDWRWADVLWCKVAADMWIGGKAILWRARFVLRGDKDSGKFVPAKQGEELSLKGVRGVDSALHLDKSVS